MNTRKPLGLVPVLVLTATLAACGGAPTEGKPNPEANTSEHPSSGAPASDTPQKLLAPPVPKPLNARPFLSKDQICKILNANQAKQLGIEQPHIAKEPVANGLMVSCDYDDSGNSDITLGINFGMANPNGLSDIYRQKEKEKTWEPLAVEGYPAVIVDRRDDNGHSGTCIAYLGVTDHLNVMLNFGSGYDMDKNAACEKDKQAAGMVISNLKLQR